MSISNQLKNQHLMWRAGFGPSAEQVPEIGNFTPQEYYKALRKASAKKPAYIDVADDYLKGLVMGIQEAGRQQRQRDLSTEQKKEIQKKQRESVRNLNIYWLESMVTSEAQLREKLALFWHGHFACRNLNVFYQQELLHVIRQHALGNFRDLLFGVSRSAAMLNFLNNNQNRKDHPNENFAREVMELFTLGRGHYTEQDIKEAARAFTGWGANARGEFMFRPFQHDNGMKTVLGKTGHLTGDDVLEILLSQKQTARFICARVYRFFVNDQVDGEKADWLAERFYQNNYDIGRLMEDIFASEWFYDARNIGCRIKSPVELIVGIQRMLPMTLEQEEALLVLQRLLGQLLFYPPNVAGWPGGKTWIDSSTLMLRMRLPLLINDADEWNVSPKTDDDQAMGRADSSAAPRMGAGAMYKNRKPINARVDWNAYIKNFSTIDRPELLNTIAGYLLQTREAVGADLIRKFSNESSRENFIRTATLQLMSTPEYQLC